MPEYDSLDDLPPGQGEIEWDYLIEYLKGIEELHFLKSVENFESGAATADQCPYLAVVRVLDYYHRETLGVNAKWKYDCTFGLRITVYDDGTDTRKRIQECDRATTQLLKVLRSAAFQRQPGHWYKASLPPRTVTFNNMQERVFSTTRLDLFYAFAPGT